MALLDDLRQRRTAAREAADQILTRAAEDRATWPPTSWRYQARVVEQREADDAIEQEHERQLAEARAAARTGRGPTLTRAALDTRPRVPVGDLRQEPGPDRGLHRPARRVARRPARARPGPRRPRPGPHPRHPQDHGHPGDGHRRLLAIVQHLVETSSLMAAGATVVTTATGEDLVVPKSTGFVTLGDHRRGRVASPSRDPTLGTVTLKAFKYANYFEISQELANDTPTNLLDFLARQAALSLGLGATGYGDDLINGVGTTEPRGLLLDAGTGVTGPAGTGTSLGTQGTANQGTDALWNLIGSVAEPYAAAASAAFLMRNASDIIVRKLRDTTGQPVAGLGRPARSILGYPSYARPVHAGHGQRRRVDRLRRHVASTSSGWSTASASSAPTSSGSRTTWWRSAASCASTAPWSTPAPSRPSSTPPDPVSDVRRCLGCSATYPLEAHACPKCGSHAAEVEEGTVAKPKPARRRKT